MSKDYLGIDPGPKETGWVIFDGEKIIHHQIANNDEFLSRLESTVHNDQTKKLDCIAVEMIAHYGTGMPVGAEVFETAVFIGRIIQICKPLEVQRIFRREVKIELCGSMKAKDANIRKALLDKIGPQGTKKRPGPTYGIKSHEWSALAIAYTAWKKDTQGDQLAERRA